MDYRPYCANIVNTLLQTSTNILCKWFFKSQTAKQSAQTLAQKASAGCLAALACKLPFCFGMERPECCSALPSPSPQQNETYGPGSNTMTEEYRRGIPSQGTPKQTPTKKCNYRCLGAKLQPLQQPPTVSHITLAKHECLHV